MQRDRRFLGMLILVIALIGVVPVPTRSQEKDRSPFEIIEVYTQVDVEKPLLVKGEAPKHTIRLGESLRLWITVHVREGAQSPCTYRSDDPCRFEFRVAKKDADFDTLEYVGIDTRVKDQNEFSTAYPITRDSTLGAKVFIFRVRYKDKVLNTFTIPLEVEE